MVDKFLKKIGIKNENDLLLYGGIAAVSWILATNYFKKGNAFSFYTAYDTVATPAATPAPTVQELKDKILQNIIQRAQDVNVVITNLASIKTKIESYNAKLQLLVGEIAGSRLPTYVIQQYLQNIIKEITDALKIKINLPMSGGWGYPLGDPYQDYYQQYIGNLQNYYGQYYNQFQYYDPQSYYYQPNYYYPQTNPYYSYQQTYNPGYQGYSQQPYSYGYPSYGGAGGAGGYPSYPQQGYY